MSSPEHEINLDDYFPVLDRVRAKNKKQDLDAHLFAVFIKHLSTSSAASHLTLDADLKGLVKQGKKDAAVLYRNANTTDAHRQKLMGLLVPEVHKEAFKFKPSNAAGEYKLYDCIRQLHQAGYRSGPRQIKLDNKLFNILKLHLTASKANTTKDTLIATITTLQHEFVLKEEKSSAFSLYRNANTTNAHRQKLIELLIPEANRKDFQFEPSNAVGDYKLYECMKQLNQAGFGNGHLEDFRHLMARIQGNRGRFSFLSGYATGHLEDFRRQIHGVKYKNNFWLLGLFSTIGTAFSFAFFHLNPDKLLIVEQTLEHTVPSLFERGMGRLTQHTLPVVKDFLGKTFSALKNIPLLLVLATIFRIPFQISSTWFNDDFKSPLKRLQKFIAGVLPPILSIIAYGICYMANGVFTFPAVAFFVAASFVDVLDNGLTLYLLSRNKQNNATNTAPDNLRSEKMTSTQLTAHINALKKHLIEAQITLRQAERRARTWKTAPVKFIAAIFTTIAAALWCYFPPSFFIMLSCIAFIGLVGFTKNARLSKIHTDSTEHLQADLNKLSEQTKEDLAPFEQALSALKARSQRRNARKAALRTTSGDSLVFSQLNEGGEQEFMRTSGTSYRDTRPLPGMKRPHNLDYLSDDSASHADNDGDDLSSITSSEKSATFS